MQVKLALELLKSCQWAFFLKLPNSIRHSSSISRKIPIPLMLIMQVKFTQEPPPLASSYESPNPFSHSSVWSEICIETAY